MGQYFFTIDSLIIGQREYKLSTNLSVIWYFYLFINSTISFTTKALSTNLSRNKIKTRVNKSLRLLNVDSIIEISVSINSTK